MATITYSNKSFLNQNPSVPNVNKVTDNDMNEIKTTVNTNYNEVGNITNLTTTDKSSIVNSINEIVTNYEYVALYGSHSAAYTHTLVLNDDALKFRELIVVTGNSGTDAANKSVILPIINGTIYSGGTTQTYRWLDIDIKSYTQNTKTLVLSTALWVNSSNNSSVSIVGIYGRK